MSGELSHRDCAGTGSAVAERSRPATDRAAACPTRALREIATEEAAQTLVLVGLSLSLLLALVGLAIDIAWYQLSVDRMQRAADAGALAGVVYLPGNPASAFAAAKAEAAKNGYTDGASGALVAAQQDPTNNRTIVVTVSAPVPTFFARLVGVSTFQGSRRARAEFILPVPMGSPLNYYGIYKLCDTSGMCNGVNGPDGSPLNSQGFWGAVITKGGRTGNGDAYSPTTRSNGTPNLQYDPNGYGYLVEMPPGTTSGEVWLFDASFCAVGRGPSGPYLGTGDHWIGNGGRPVSTLYRLWLKQGSPYSTTQDVLLADSGTTFFDQDQVDKGPQFSGNGSYSDGGYDGSASGDCSSDPYHNGWYKLGQNLREGTYRVQVTTSLAGNDNTNAENMFGIAALSHVSTGARVYGWLRMATYTNVNIGTSLFYLAQVDAVHAGKTLEIRLFDPGDVGGNAFLRVKRPTGTGYVTTSFDFRANGGIGAQSGSNVTQIQTSVNGQEQYDDSWITITVPIPATYGQGGVTPPGETEPGWWKIEYQVTSNGNDTAVWEVNIRGNPVHLIVP